MNKSTDKKAPAAKLNLHLKKSPTAPKKSGQHSGHSDRLYHLSVQLRHRCDRRLQNALSASHFGLPAWANLMLIVVATLLGIISCRTGLTTSVLARKSMGGRSSAILSFLLAVSAVNWIAVNADTFAKLIGSTFSWWPIPVGITAIIVVALWAQSAIRGVNGLEIVSWLGVPCAIVLTIACAIAIGTKAGYASVFAYTPPSDLQISFAAGSTSLLALGSSAVSSPPTYAAMQKAPSMSLSALPSPSPSACSALRSSAS